MQNKNYLLPLLSLLGVIIAVVGLFLTAWILTGSAFDTMTFGFFSSLDGAATELGTVNVILSSIWATLAMISLLIGIVAIILNAILRLLKDNKAINENMIAKILAWVSGIALIAFVAFGLIFTIVNSGSIAEPATEVGFKFGIGYWLGLIGLAFGSFFSIINSCTKRSIL
ncbi:MAG: hypothetical protein PHX09_00650 [Clostridia bacterium]|nr:hypothetical protein [Clostridia bacterium]MDD4685880.1 hypothetical protein [Clostridia bacterium]